MLGGQEHALAVHRRLEVDALLCDISKVQEGNHLKERRGVRLRRGGTHGMEEEEEHGERDCVKGERAREV